MISFAQNFEDVILWRCLSDVSQGFYVDFGANHPVHSSVTKWFYDNGWRGLNVEPHPELFKELARDRVRDINQQVAVSAQRGYIDFFLVEPHGLSTLDSKLADHYRSLGAAVNQIVVESKSASEMLELYASETIHFMKIDIEGGEKLVLADINFEKWRPWIIVVESTKPMSMELNFYDWEHFLLDAKYLVVYDDGLNRFYLASEHYEARSKSFRLPPGVFDGFKVYDHEKYEMSVELSQLKRSVEQINKHFLSRNIMKMLNLSRFMGR